MEKIPNQEKLLPPEFFEPSQHMVTPAFVKYALPLIGGNLPEFPAFKRKSPSL